MLNDAVNQSQQTDLPKDLAFLTEQLSHLTDEFPFEVVSKIIEQSEFATLNLFDLLNYALDNHSNDLAEDYIGHIYAIYLLSQFREQSALPLLLEIACLPEQTLEHLFGECIDEDLHRFIASTFNGDLALIKNIIESETTHKTARNAALKSLAVLAINKQINNKEFIEYLETLFSHNIFISDREAFAELVHVCYDIEPIHFYQQIKGAIVANKIDSALITLEFFEKQIASVKTGDVVINPYGEYDLINDTIKEMSNWHCFKNDAELEIKENSESHEHNQEHTHSHEHHHHDGCCGSAQQPIVRDDSKVGRNDPCACGSGKKYKKCCL